MIDGLPAAFAPIRTPEAPTNLPAEPTSFVGREHELEEIRQLLKPARLVTLTGPGGSGKTRLAVRATASVLDRFPDGAFFVDLSSITAPHLVPGAIASALGTGQRGRVSVTETLRMELRHRTLLLVLDNFEQVVEASSVVAHLLAAAPGLKFLVTSRGPLRLRGEQEFPVPPLQLPDPGRLPALEDLSRYEATALFLERATAIDPGFSVTRETTSAVVEICRRLDGLPLAIELAASRLRLISPKGMRERLDRVLPLLASGHRHPPAGTTPVAASASPPSAAAQSGGPHTRTASPTTGWTPPRDPYADNNTRTFATPMSAGFGLGRQFCDTTYVLDIAPPRADTLLR